MFQQIAPTCASKTEEHLILKIQILTDRPPQSPDCTMIISTDLKQAYCQKMKGCLHHSFLLSAGLDNVILGSPSTFERQC